MHPTTTRTLRDAEECKRRQGLLDLPHIRPLTDFTKKLRAEKPETFVPCFDPLDGGTTARVLFLFEKPGPKTSPDEGGSGFISRDNDDHTAEATFCFMRDAGVPRYKTVLWNVIPWWNGTRKVTNAERNAGIERVEQLIRLLPLLGCVVFVGGHAARAKAKVAGLAMDLRLVESYHPSPIVKATAPEKWTSIPGRWAQVMDGR
ncbi:uracil-DNA glycosylase [Candidatus Palauibacter sp.]|uniref:uracil-DNA glycosylase n=1 Tax=Candidatus Palauibacter sp. TaxID=3101350 RepID=UPI003B5CB45C